MASQNDVSNSIGLLAVEPIDAKFLDKAQLGVKEVVETILRRRGIALGCFVQEHSCEVF